MVTNDRSVGVADRETVLSEALAAARAISFEGYRAEGLAALAPHLPETLLADALAAVHAISDEGYRAEGLAALAPYPDAIIGKVRRGKQALVSIH